MGDRCGGRAPAPAASSWRAQLQSCPSTVCGSLGFDTSGYSVPYLASWSEDADLETIERAAGVIDRIARRVEDALDSAADVGETSDQPRAAGRMTFR